MEENKKSFFEMANYTFGKKLSEFNLYITEVIPKDNKENFIEEYSKIGEKELTENENGELEK